MGTALNTALNTALQASAPQKPLSGGLCGQHCSFAVPACWALVDKFEGTPCEQPCQIAESTLCGAEIDDEGSESGESHDMEDQDHVLNFLKFLSPDMQEELQEQYDSFDFRALEFARGSALSRLQITGNELEVPEYLSWTRKAPPKPEEGANLTNVKDAFEWRVNLWRRMGLQIIGHEQVAVILMCGGTENQLSLPAPKATMNIGLVSKKSIFQLYCERLHRLIHIVARTPQAVRSNSFQACKIPLYIMCNRDNIDSIEDFFTDNQFFGLPQQDVLFFIQDEMPLVDRRKRLLLESLGDVWTAPNGNGGVFAALRDHGALSDIKARHIEYLYISSTDNVAAKICDPTFLGHVKFVHMPAAVKCIERKDADEVIGIFANRIRISLEDVDNDGDKDEKKNYRGMVFEPAEFPLELVDKKVEGGGGRLEFNNGSICQFVCTIEHAQKAAERLSKRWHVTYESVPYVNVRTGELEDNPMVENALRLEMFTADILELAKYALGFRVDGDEEYAPFKDLEHDGPFCPFNAVTTYSLINQAMLIKAGAHFYDNRVAGGDPSYNACEVSPLVSYDGESLEGLFPEGTEQGTLRLPLHLASPGELRNTRPAMPLEEKKELPKHLRPRVQGLKFAGKPGSRHLDEADKDELLERTKKKIHQQQELEDANFAKLEAEVEENLAKLAHIHSQKHKRRSSVRAKKGDDEDEEEEDNRDDDDDDDGFKEMGHEWFADETDPAILDLKKKKRKQKKLYVFSPKGPDNNLLRQNRGKRERYAKVHEVVSWHSGHPEAEQLWTSLKTKENQKRLKGKAEQYKLFDEEQVWTMKWDMEQVIAAAKERAKKKQHPQRRNSVSGKAKARRASASGSALDLTRASASAIQEPTPDASAIQE